ncbi:TrmH family RNA methyltransferase [Treponema sp. OMZ 855]|uniref:TrmH family RNA methyltransferase n=1 Tax=Treponema sp. OMZ 855 TaxID=1643512 RepID=UPI0020A3C441|nr:TrmH family RNA methyltransferase [Treponema sp. OMZ 855]UTC50943.1 TrmH family RNA methyltransferase [Treponema sp. OMZ 855]
MIELFKLVRLPTTQKIRKVIKILEILEAECVPVPSGLPCSAVSLSCDSFYIEGLCAHLASMYPSDSVITAAVKTYISALRAETLTAGDYRVLFNTLRHALYRQSGVQPSEWDLIAPGLHYGIDTPKHDTTVPNPAAPDAETQTGKPSAAIPVMRPSYPGVYVYAEDIRAPFNLGSIFRTAEAFGAEKLLLSEGCVSPEQPRAQRSAMGCTHFLPWEYCPLEALPADLPVFALETGGTPITSFSFPKHGIVLLGSEELGLSAEALKKVSAGIVSIPMKGIKASLNVAVAFGILMQCWIASLKDTVLDKSC